MRGNSICVNSILQNQIARLMIFVVVQNLCMFELERHFYLNKESGQTLIILVAKKRIGHTASLIYDRPSVSRIHVDIPIIATNRLYTW